MAPKIVKSAPVVDKHDDSSRSRKKSTKRRNKESYSTHIHKVLKQCHPDVGISSKAMGIMNDMVDDLYLQLAADAARLVAHGKTSTMGSREVQTATRLMLPGELGKHAISEGTKAITVYTKACST